MNDESWSESHSLTPTEKKALESELKRRVNNLALLQTRQAKYGLDVPLSLLNEISDEKERIVEIKERLAGTIEEPSLTALLFKKGNVAFILGDLGEAKRYYQMVLKEDPHYPRAAELLRRVENVPRGGTGGLLTLNYARLFWEASNFFIVYPKISIIVVTLFIIISASLCWWFI